MPQPYAARRLRTALTVASLAGLAACGSTSTTTTGGPTQVATSSVAGTPSSVAPSSAAPAPAATGPIGSPADLAVLAGVTVTEGGPKEAPAVTWATKPLVVTATTRTILTPGTGGSPSAIGSIVTAHLALFKGSDGAKLDSTFESGTPQPLALDPEETVPGFITGLLGLSAGARALIVIPPKDAYGEKGRPEIGVSPTENLVLLADIVSVSTPLKQAEGTPVAPVPGLPTVTFDPTTGPAITVPTTTAPPTALVSQSLVEGTGAAVKAGDTVQVHYTGVLWKDGSVFDSSWTRGAPFSFQVGTGGVIKAWDNGFLGKKVGSRVLLVVPPADGYGANGSPPKISGTDTLVFVVDILAAS